MVDLQTMFYHARSKGSLPSLPSENRKGKKKMTNDKAIGKTIEKERSSNKLVSGLEQKIRELEKDISDMCEWDKLLLSIYPSFETNTDKQPVTNQATFQNNPPPTVPSFIHLPRNTHILNYQYPPQHNTYASRPPYLTLRLQFPTLQTPRYQTPPHQVP
ncbi:hypothetical protein KY290_006347 [Solanum tuberosum]|uniref:Uncharacterized protein n=1 Tax=Solanum tuberosum TaxID=4113 RepID=A0ABQ7WGR5_SOLTU|nr:hypothetical protein KY289_005979 [Solanum tuberosum]KAH0761053.1 hypothetical protein KY290_017126 [Solanum tuberosum]KAH0779920.1 hypothetical protein KY290_006347 [Solanum tuberosum]